MRRVVLALAAWIVCSLAAAQGLPAGVDAALAQAKVPRESVTLLVAPVEGGGARLAHRSDVPVNPASIAKLVTTFAALELLGPAYAWSTPVYLEGAVRDGVLHGNLHIRGLGDPKLVVERLWLLMRRVQGMGIRQIAGDIVLDRSAFAPMAADAGSFDNEPLRPYNARPDALLLNYRSLVLTFTPEGSSARVHMEPPLAGVQAPASVPLVAGDCGDWRTPLRADFNDPTQIRLGGSYPLSCGERVWPIAYVDPQSYAARAVAGMWQSVGGQLSGQVREGRVPPNGRPSFEIVSPALPEIVRDINKYSNNVMAQQLFLTLSLHARGVGSMEGSREVVSTWWRERFGGEPPFVENGSGLSRTDRITAGQLGQLLRGAWISPYMSELMSSLPVSGLDGTMRRARRNVGLAHLKTGSLRDVAGVAGYVHGASGRRYVLVAIANHPNANAARPAFEALVEWAARDQ